jgi:hypothetical protein
VCRAAVIYARLGGVVSYYDNNFSTHLSLDNNINIYYKIYKYKILYYYIIILTSDLESNTRLSKILTGIKSMIFSDCLGTLLKKYYYIFT